MYYIRYINAFIPTPKLQILLTVDKEIRYKLVDINEMSKLLKKQTYVISKYLFSNIGIWLANYNFKLS